jgi:type I restriction enzyme, S subunit
MNPTSRTNLASGVLDRLDGLPEGWELARLTDIFEINPPKAPLDSFEPDERVTFVPMPAVDAEKGAITAPQERPFSDVRRGFTSFQDDDVIMAKITPCMENGKIAIARGLLNGLGFGSTEFHVLRSKGAVLPEYVYHFIRQESFRRSAEREMTGSVGQKRVPVSFLEDTDMPVPPKEEQERIVESIEQLLIRVAAARVRLGRVSIILKRFRQTILAAACSGRLTAEWRNSSEEPFRKTPDYMIGNKLSSKIIQPDGGSDDTRGLFELPESWRWVSLEDVCNDITVGHVGPMITEYRDSGIPFLRSQNVREFRFDTAGLRFISSEFHRRLRKTILHPGDVVVVRSGYAGTACVIPDDLPEANCADLVIIRPSNTLNPAFACIFVNSNAGRAHVDEVKVGIAQSHFNIGAARKTPLPLPPVAEQQEIVRRVEALFKLANSIENRVAAATARADKLTQAILAKAFRGELVPTEAELARREGRDYEPASALLDRIRAKRENPVATRSESVPDKSIQQGNLWQEKTTKKTRRSSSKS